MSVRNALSLGRLEQYPPHNDNGERLMTRDWEWKLRAGRPTRYEHHEVVIYDWEKYNGEAPPENAKAFIAWLNDLIEQVPTEFQEGVYVELDSTSGYEGTHYATVKVAYRRPETDEELGHRVAEYESAVRAKEAHDRAEFDRLKTRYG
jgi:hypothetical protein